MKLQTFFIIMIFMSLVECQPPADPTFTLLVGTYTRPGKSDGIYAYKFNVESGEASLLSNTPGITNPSFLTVNHQKTHVYAVSEVGDGKASVYAYAFDKGTGKLSYLNQVKAHGDAPCYVSVDHQNKFVFVGNYLGGNLAAIPIQADGSLNENSQVIDHKGSSINPGNQEGPHVHATVLSGDDRFLFVPDLGTDKINIYKVDLNQEKPLSPADSSFVSVEPGSGPRHFTFHPNGKIAYLIHEMLGLVTAFKYENGKLEAFQTLALPQEGFSGKIDAADIHVSSDGKFLYGSLRGDINEIVICAVNANGKLTFVGRQSTLGKIPRNFAIDPSGKYLLVGNQNSDEIVIFNRNPETGLLTDSGKRIEVGAPVCLQFISEE